FGFLIALAVAVLARYVQGELAVLLLPAFSFALWLGTLSLVILAASLFTVAHIQGWSARHEREYRELDEEERVSSAFFDELRAERIRTETPGERAALAARASSGISGTVVGRCAGLLAAGVLTLSVLSASGCATPVKSATVPDKLAAVDTNTATLHAFVDTSGSCVRPALTEAWDTVKQELPTLIEQDDITQFNVWQFDEGGWSPRHLREIPLPAKQVARRQQVPGTEWSSFGNIRDALRNSEEREWRAET